VNHNRFVATATKYGIKMTNVRDASWQSFSNSLF